MGFGVQAARGPAAAAPAKLPPTVVDADALKNGLLPIVVPGAVHAKLLEFVEELPQCELQIDLATQQMTLPDGSCVQFPIDEFSKTCLLKNI